MTFIILISLLTAGPSYALDTDDAPIRSTGGISFWMDEASFLSHEQVYQEFYIQIPARGLEFRTLDDIGTALFEVEITFLGRYGEPVELQDRLANVSKRMVWRRKIEFAASEDYNDLIANETFGVLVPPGRYDAYLKIRDVHSGSVGECHLRLALPVIVDGLSLSDLQFARKVTDLQGGPV